MRPKIFLPLQKIFSLLSQFRGYSEVPKDDKRIRYAWVELFVGYIYEPIRDSLFKKDDFYKIFKPRTKKRYTPTEAAFKVCKSEHYGPWE